MIMATPDYPLIVGKMLSAFIINLKIIRYVDDVK